MYRALRAFGGVSIVAALCLAVHAPDEHAKAALHDPRLPTWRIIDGQREELTLQRDRLAVVFREGVQTARQEQAKAAGGLDIKESVSTGVRSWQLLDVSQGGGDATELNHSLTVLASEPDIAFVSPVFQWGATPKHWLIITPDLLVRIAKDHRQDAMGLLQALAPDWQIVESDLAELDGAYRLRGLSKSGFDVLQQANNLALDPRIEWAEPNYQFSVDLSDAEDDLIPNDPEWGNLWGMFNYGQFGGTPDVDLDCEQAWGITTGSPGVIVAVFDAGVQLDHPDLNTIPGYNFASDNDDFLDGSPVNSCDHHGTSVAGCIAAVINNSLGVVGVSPASPVVPIRIFITDVPCSNFGTAEAVWILNGLTFAEAMGVRVTNHSYTGPNSLALEAKYRQTHEDGMVHIAAAGNSALPYVGYPANDPYVLAVSAITPSGNLASFSNYGNSIDICAPGTSIRTTDRTGSVGYSGTDYTWFGGTSAASPYAAGVAALIFSENPALTADEAHEILMCSALDLGPAGWDESFGHGLVNGFEGVIAARGDDLDADGVSNPCDNCPSVSNPAQTDSDGDTRGDACDNCPDDANVSQTDGDADGIGDVCDNCPTVYNPGQEDLNGNSVGDACDCVCDCHGDPAQCEGTINVFDVVAAVDVAFRSQPASPDPNPLCPREMTDVTCDGVTNVFDVIGIIDVAFRSATPEAAYCDPCS